jgi:signal transduction histidine kinase
LILSGIAYRVDVTDKNGHRYYLLYNKTHFNERKNKLVIYLVTFVALMMIIALGVALWMAERVIEPVKELARRVRSLDANRMTTHLADDFARDEVGELAQTFQQTLSRLSAFIDRERAFTADISHELRTPLAVIQGAAEVLQTSENLSPNERERLERIERSAAEMAELSSALLIMAREKEEASREPINVSELVAETVEKHRHLLKNKAVEIHLELIDQPRLAVNPRLFASVVGNLVRNSFIHTDQGEVQLHLTGNQLKITDTGIGISREELSRVFMRSYKGEKSSGEGIGLSLVKKICDRYGWDIELSSEPGKGTMTTLTF